MGELLLDDLWERTLETMTEEEQLEAGHERWLEYMLWGEE